MLTFQNILINLCFFLITLVLPLSVCLYFAMRFAIRHELLREQRPRRMAYPEDEPQRVNFREKFQGGGD